MSDAFREQAEAEHAATCHDPLCDGLAWPPTYDVIEKARHYNVHPSGVECIDIVRHMTFNTGNAVKYIFRCWEKNGREDIDKARYYLADGLRHADRIFLPSWGYRQDALLGRVVRAEVDPNRLGFFRAVKHGQLEYARDKVLAMLDAA